MPTLKEIRVNYGRKHDELSKRYYQKHELTEESFNLQHGKIWVDMEAELKTASDYTEPELPRNLYAEIDDLKARFDKMTVP